jgi:hypothetical protein
MEAWLRSAVDYIGRWIEFQLIGFQQVGCIIAITPRRQLMRFWGYLCCRRPSRRAIFLVLAAHHYKGRCSAFASCHGALIQASRPSSGWIGATTALAALI